MTCLLMLLFILGQLLKFDFPEYMERHEIYNVYMKLPKISVCLKDIKDLFRPLPKDTENKLPKTSWALGRPGIGKTFV